MQAVTVMTGLLVGGMVVLQPQTVGGLWARAAASLGWGIDRGWAVATNIRTLALPTKQPPQWDAVDVIHRLLATEEYPNHNQDCGRVLVYAQNVHAGFGAQVRNGLRLSFRSTVLMSVQERLILDRITVNHTITQINQMLTAFLVALNEHRAFVVHPHFLNNYFCEVRIRSFKNNRTVDKKPA